MAVCCSRDQPDLPSALSQGVFENLDGWSLRWTHEAMEDQNWQWMVQHRCLAQEQMGSALEILANLAPELRLRQLNVSKAMDDTGEVPAGEGWKKSFCSTHAPFSVAGSFRLLKKRSSDSGKL